VGFAALEYIGVEVPYAPGTGSGGWNFLERNEVIFLKSWGKILQSKKEISCKPLWEFLESKGTLS